MADDTVHPAPLVDPEAGLLPQTEPEPAPETDEAPSTPSRLRAFEELILGPDHVRPHDQIERGVGSPFSALSAQHKAHHAALEALIEAEREHQAASAAEDAAHSKLEAAVQRAAETEEALDPPPVDSDEEQIAREADANG